MNDPQEPASGLFYEIRRVYKNSLKTHDIFWNIYVARPAAAVLVYILARTPITPNQVSFLGAALFVLVALMMIFMRDSTGFLLAAVMLEISYFFDCADGQLARLTKKTSPVGAYLDFLIDEIKALLLVAALSIRLWWIEDTQVWLFVGLGGALLVSVATSLTTFIRRPAYAGQEIKPGVQSVKKMPASFVGKIVWIIENFAKWLIHYPSWFLYLAILDISGLIHGARWFLYLYLGVYMIYTARTGLSVFLKLASFKFYPQAPLPTSLESAAHLHSDRSEEQ